MKQPPAPPRPDAASGPTASEQFAACFGRPPDYVARAPGRIEFIGNHTDYNDGLVLGAAIAQQVEVAVARRSDARWNFASGQQRTPTAVATAAFDRHTGPSSWVNYPLGILHTFAAYGLRLPDGFDYFVSATLPVGAGLSSSAAIELASALAFLALTGDSLPRERLVALARQAENEFVGVPCGILDQGVSAFGREGHLVSIDCRGPTFDLVPLPDEVRFWLFNTHTKHALVDGLYATRHRECLDAAKALGVAALRDATPATVAAANLPPPLDRRARHVTEEIARVRQTIAALRTGDVAAVGTLLTASHRSSQHLFENSTPELDLLVDVLTAQPGVYGARLSGGGFGGAVMAMTSAAFGPRQISVVTDAYRDRFGSAVGVFETQTGNGAALVGAAELRVES